MEDQLSTLAAGGGGTVLLFLAYKALWPLLKNGIDVQLANGRTENALLKQLIEERNYQQARADEVTKQMAEAILKIADLQSQLQVVSSQAAELGRQLESANQQIADLRTMMSPKGPA